MTDATKRCRSCGETLPLARFSPSRVNKDGRISYCKPCNAAKAKERREADPERARSIKAASYARNAEQRRAEARARYWADPDASRAYDRAWKRTDRAVATRRAYQSANRTKIQAVERKRRRANPLPSLLEVHRRRARAAGVAVVAFDEAQFRARMSMFDGCWMCGNPAGEIDHIKPISKGGAHMLCNLRPACAPCNMTKGAKWPAHQATPMATANATEGFVPAAAHVTCQ